MVLETTHRSTDGAERHADAGSKGRVKKWAPKSATGCFCCRFVIEARARQGNERTRLTRTVCRARRVKCGEEKPRCRRCIKRGEECSYPSIRTEQQQKQEAAEPELDLVRPAAPVYPAGVKASAQDKEMFYMFRQDTAERLCGFSDVEFWSSDVLRASQAYAPVWYANLALAAMSRSKVAGERYPEQWSVMAMRYYGKAIQAMLQTTRKRSIAYRDKEALLMTEALLVGVNSVAGCLQQASKHATNAVTLYDAWRFQMPQGERTGEAVLRKESLMTIVTSFRSQTVNRRFHDTPPTSQDDYARALEASTSEPFQSLAEAYELLIPLYTCTLTDMASIKTSPDGQDDGYPPSFRALRDAMEAWSAKLVDLERRQPPETASERFGFMLLWALSEGMLACHYCDWRDGIFMFDRFTPLCYSVLRKLEEWLEAEGGQPHGAPFSFSTSIAELSWWIGISCHDYEFRCRVVRLLKAWDVRDGLWDTRLLAAVIETYIEVENRNGIYEDDDVLWDCGCLPGEFVCGEHRIGVNQIDFVRPGEAIFTFSTIEEARISAPPRTKVLYY